MFAFIAGLSLTVLVGGYFLWVRPLLLRNPKFAELSGWEFTTWDKVGIKFAGIKQKLVTRLVALAGTAVTVYDLALPLAKSAGFDVTTYEPLTKIVPSSAWPLITMALLGLVQYFRNISDVPQKTSAGEAV